MSQPDPRFITVPHAEEDVASLLDDLFVKPRSLIRKWAEITSQTAQARLAYPGQHLASVVTGVPGMGTAARGEDLIDGSEVKSCSKADQLGQCKDCGTRVPAWMTTCPSCDSDKITRKEDSHWIVSLRREQELEQLLDSRIVFVLFDRTTEERADIRVRVWEVWPREDRHAYAVDFFTDYFENNYTEKRKAGLDPSPCNLHPLKFDHLMMNPVKVLDATIARPDSEDASVSLDFFHPAPADRAALDPEPMPVGLCKKAELEVLRSEIAPEEFAECLRPDKHVEEIRAALEGSRPVEKLDAVITGIPSSVRRKFAMRTKRIKTTPTTYRRRRNEPGSA